MYLSTQLSDVELPEGLAFEDPEEEATLHDENALDAFLKEFEEKHNLLEVVGLFPVDSQE
jgi:hypothetical protein